MRLYQLQIHYFLYNKTWKFSSGIVLSNIWWHLNKSKIFSDSIYKWSDQVLSLSPPIGALWLPDRFWKRTNCRSIFQAAKMQNSKWVAGLYRGRIYAHWTTCPGFKSRCYKKIWANFLSEKFVDAGIYWQPCSEAPAQRLGNVVCTHLHVASGKLTLKKIYL